MDDTGQENALPCADKITYESQSEAVGAAAAVEWQRGTSLKAYVCRYCQLWHLATKTNDTD